MEDFRKNNIIFFETPVAKGYRGAPLPPPPNILLDIFFFF